MLIGACQGPTEDVRPAEIRAFLHDDNAIWAADEPALLAEKYHRMAADPYDFMRGTLGLYYTDVAANGRFGDDTTLLHVFEATEVLIVGDPHPENLGTIRGETEAISLEWVDLDAASHGPYLLDLRRAALGLALYGGVPCDQSCQAQLVEVLATTYVGVIDGWHPSAALRAPTPGALLDDLLEEAVEEGEDRRRFRRFTEKSDLGHRIFELEESDECDDEPDPAAPPTSDCRLEEPETIGHWPVTPAEATELDTLVAQVSVELGPEFRVLDVARRFGKGVASLPARRYTVLWDRGEDGRDDDELLNIRMVVPPPQLPGRASHLAAAFPDGAERIRRVNNALWSQADPLAHGLSVDGLVFKTSSASSWFQVLDHETVAEKFEKGKADYEDLTAVARWVGHTLALTHCRGHLPDGRPTHEFLQRDLLGKSEVLHADLARWLTLDHARMLGDYAHFRALLERSGPILDHPAAP